MVSLDDEAEGSLKNKKLGEFVFGHLQRWGREVLSFPGHKVDQGLSQD